VNVAWLDAGPDAFLMESVFRREVWGFMQQPVSVENEQAVCEGMISGCEAAVASYPTSLADDIRQLAEVSKGDNSPRALALRVRMVRIKLVPEVFQITYAEVCIS
jgi:[ribulose-bisphosphate carboxylase]/[fructose-bisphosphate aldolase]-lysine N-methyltransferase